MEKLLSIAIPTKNRQEFLIPLLKLLHTFDLADIEIIIQDNSDDEKVIQNYLREYPCEAFQYFHVDGEYSQMENSEFALERCKGKYVCFLGDDDYISRYLIEYVKKMDEYGLECTIFHCADYVWPGINRKGYKLPDLTIPKFHGKIRKVSVADEFRKLIAHGAISLYDTPQTYHGIVLKSKLDEVKRQTGVYIPGPSPDMAIAVSLSSVVRNMAYCDVPYTTSGKSIKSAGGLGLQHEHKGELSRIKMLPGDIEKRWINTIPRIWTAPTIYAQSCNEALEALGDKKSLQCFNWNYFYAYFYISSKEYRCYLADAVENCEAYHPLKFRLDIIKAFVEKCVRYLSIRLSVKYRSIIKNGLPTVYEAGLYTDDVISKVDIEKMFDEIRQ